MYDMNEKFLLFLSLGVDIQCMKSKSPYLNVHIRCRYKIY